MSARGRVYFWQGGSLWIGRGKGRSQWHGHDARIAKALGFVRPRIRGPIRLSEVAGAAALSPDPFRHLFVQETGTAFRPYLLWLRLNVAIECSMDGRSWTEAAHEAGFSDSAHLTRTFKRMFGMNPATLVRQ